MLTKRYADIEHSVPPEHLFRSISNPVRQAKVRARAGKRAVQQRLTPVIGLTGISKFPMRSNRADQRFVVSALEDGKQAEVNFRVAKTRKASPLGRKWIGTLKVGSRANERRSRVRLSTPDT